MFSIIIAVKDGMHTIERAIRSCLRQSYSDLEVVVVSNGTSDSTAEVAASIGDSRVKVIEIPQPGRSHARNVGLSASMGEYIVFLDADDEISPDMLSAARAIINYSSDGVDAVQGATKYVRNGEVIKIVYPFNGEGFWKRLLVRNTIPINSMVVRREHCAKFPSGVEHCEDWDFWIRTLRGANVLTCGRTDSIVHLSDSSTSADVNRMKAFEIPVQLSYLNQRIKLDWEFRRGVLLFGNLAIYSQMKPIRLIDSAAKENRAAWFILGTLRKRRLLREKVISINRKLIRY